MATRGYLSEITNPPPQLLRHISGIRQGCVAAATPLGHTQNLLPGRARTETARRRERREPHTEVHGALGSGVLTSKVRVHVGSVFRQGLAPGSCSRGLSPDGSFPPGLVPRMPPRSPAQVWHEAATRLQQQSSVTVPETTTGPPEPSSPTPRLLAGDSSTTLMCPHPKQADRDRVPLNKNRAVQGGEPRTRIHHAIPGIRSGLPHPDGLTLRGASPQHGVTHQSPKAPPLSAVHTRLRFLPLWQHAGDAHPFLLEAGVPEAADLEVLRERRLVPQREGHGCLQRTAATENGTRRTLGRSNFSLHTAPAYGSRAMAMPLVPVALWFPRDPSFCEL